jgi:outer membrane cobalamin receptor
MAVKITGPLSVNKLFQGVRVNLTVIFIAALLSTTNIFAAQRGRVEGMIKDPSGSSVTHARVVLRDNLGAVLYQAITDSNGRFTLEVNDGRYKLSVEASGFSQANKVEVEVQAGETKNVDVELIVAAISDHLVVTATRTATPGEEIAGSVSVITNMDLQRTGQSQISEPLRLIPGVAVLQSGGRGSITSVFTRGGESDYNKVLIDGVPVNAAGGLFDFAFLTPENFERLEVVRGPRSALFGSDAMTGVFQLFTRRGTTETPELELSGEGGSFDYHRETAILSGLTRWFDYSGSFGYQKTDGRFRNSDFLNRSASVNLGFQLGTKADLHLASRLNNNSLGVPDAVARQFADPDQRQKHHDIALSGTLDWRTTSRWSQTARFIFSEFETHSFDPAGEDLSKPDTPVWPPGSFGSDFVFTFRDHQKRLGIHYQTIAALSSTNVLTGGVDFEHESGVFTDDFSRVSPERNNLGFYVQDQVAIAERFYLTAGLRLERNTGDVPDDLREALNELGNTTPIGDVGFGVRSNPKLAATYYARRDQTGRFGATKLNASFGTGIKEPSLVEAFSPSIFFLGNPSLKPERATSFDLGLVQEFFNRRASVEATYFANRFRDQIVFVFDPVTFGAVRLDDGRLTNFINQERATARGIELAGTARPALKLRLSANYTFLRSRLDRSEKSPAEVRLPLLRRPRHSGAFAIDWLDNRFDLTLDGSLVGRRRDLDPISGSRFDLRQQPIFNEGYAKLNFAGAYRFADRYTAFVRVENLLNQQYEEILGFPAYKINFRAGVRVRIGGGK